MKRRTVLFLALIFLYLVVSQFFSGQAAARDEAAIAKATPHSGTLYEVPEGKKAKWESIRRLVQKEYDVCIEHCGNDTACLDRCEKAYKTRLEREYKQLMYK